MNTGLTLTAAGALLAGLVVAAPAHADPPSYGSNGVFGVGDRADEWLGDSQHPAGHVSRRPVPEHVSVSEPAWFLAAVQQLPCAGNYPGHIIASGNALRDQSTFVDILPTDVAVSLGNVTLTIAGPA